MLLTGSGDELFGPLPTLFQAMAYLPHAVSPSTFPAFVYWKFAQISAPCLSPFSGVLSATPPRCCFRFWFLVYWYCLAFLVFFFFFFFLQWMSVCPGDYVVCWFILGVLGEYCMMLGAHLLVCWMSPKQVRNQCLAAQQPFSFLSVTWHGEAFQKLGVQGVKVLILLSALFPSSVAPVFQLGFGVTELTLSASVP
jgi:hypothetical protein